MIVLAVSPGCIGTWANPSQHVYGPPGRHNHLNVPWGRQTVVPASCKSRGQQPVRRGAARGWREPHPLWMAVVGKVWSWGIQQDTLAPMKHPRSIVTHDSPLLILCNFGGNRAQIGSPGPVQSVTHGIWMPHNPMIGLAVSPGCMGTHANPSQHVYGPPGGHNHLNVPRGRQTFVAASRKSRGQQPVRPNAARGWREPHLPPMAVVDKASSWSIQQDILAPMKRPRSIATHDSPLLILGDFGGNRAQIGSPGPVQSVTHGIWIWMPHNPMIGLAVSPGCRGTGTNPSQHVYGPPGRHK